MRPVQRLLICLVACSGVVWLLTAQSTKTRLVDAVALANPAMNFAYVRVSGTVVNYPIVDSASGLFSIVVRDRTGDIRIAIVSSSLIKSPTAIELPMPGDRVSVDGNLRVREGEPTIWVHDPASIEVDHGVSAKIQLAGLEAFAPGEKIEFEAQIRSIRETATVRIFSVRDGNASVDVVTPLKLEAYYGRLQSPAVGDWVSISGAVGEYHQMREVLTDGSTGITRLPLAHEWDVRSIGALTRPLNGTWVAVSGTVRDVKHVGSATRIAIDDEQAKALTVVMYESWQLVPFSSTLRPGATIAAQGLLIADRGTVPELRPELPIDIALR